MVQDSSQQTQANFEDTSEQKWDLVITSRRGLFRFSLTEIWRYRDLLGMLVRREVVVLYKQTILGPIWFFIQPLLTAAVYIVVFSRIAGISTDGLPPVLFYLSGAIIWNFFSESFNSTSQTFVQNANLFGKVYFPRIIVPLSKVISGLLKFLIQFCLFLFIYGWYLVREADLHPNWTVALVPVMILVMGILGLGLGIFFTSLTTKYRDLVFLIQFGVQLLMYATPVIYPLSAVPEKYAYLIKLNPMTAILEGFRFAFLGTGGFDVMQMMLSLGISLVILVAGLTVFNYIEKDFMDTV